MFRPWTVHLSSPTLLVKAGEALALTGGQPYPAW